MVLPINGTSPQQPPANPVPPNPKGDMSGQDTFMKLLVAELKYQDPMDPLQNKDMVAQLATLSSVQKLTGIDEKLANLRQDTVQGSAATVASLIGKTVTAKTNRLTVDSLGAVTGSYQLQGDADSVRVSVINGSGETVRTFDTGATTLGAKSFEWDGNDISGRRVPNGDYTFKVEAVNAAGAPVVSTSQVSGPVSEIVYKNGDPAVVIGGAQVGLSDVTSIAQEASR
jgi:flagellar basal-body rod modification protein FlgD